MNNQEQTTPKGGRNQETTNEPEKKKSVAVIKLFRAVLLEIGLILWISAEFFSGVARPKIAIWLLGVSVILFFHYIVLKTLGSKISKKYKRAVWPFFLALCVLIFVGCCMAVSVLNEEWRVANEPKVTPSVVQLHSGKFDKLTRVLISNPSDSWIYHLMLLIQVDTPTASTNKMENWSLQLPSKPFQGIPLQGPPTGQP